MHLSLVACVPAHPTSVTNCLSGRRGWLCFCYGDSVVDCSGSEAYFLMVREREQWECVSCVSVDDDTVNVVRWDISGGSHRGSLGGPGYNDSAVWMVSVMG